MQLSGFDLRHIISEGVIGQCGSTWAILRLKQVCVFLLFVVGLDLLVQVWPREQR